MFQHGLFFHLGEQGALGGVGAAFTFQSVHVEDGADPSLLSAPPPAALPAALTVVLLVRIAPGGAAPPTRSINNEVLGTDLAGGSGALTAPAAAVGGRAVPVQTPPPVEAVATFDNQLETTLLLHELHQLRGLRTRAEVDQSLHHVDLHVLGEALDTLKSVYKCQKKLISEQTSDSWTLIEKWPFS